MTIASQYGVRREGGDPKLKLPLVACAPTIATPVVVREPLAVKSASRETKPASETKPNRGGRPRKHDIEPWIAAGVSKATWFRRQKAAAK